jgi:hypothetical protein
MLRKMLIGLATITAIGIASVPMHASARGGGGGGHGGGGGFHGGGGGGFHGGGAAFHGGGAAFHGGLATGGQFSGGFGATRFAAMPGRTGFGGMSGRGFHHHHHHFRNFALFGIGVPYAYADYYPYYDDCYDLVRVRTYHGWRWRHVYVCG